MKPEGSVRHKLRQVQFRHLKRELRRGLSRRPTNCGHNATLLLPGGPVQICSLGSPGEGYTPCDEAWGGLEKAGSCPQFQCLHTEESLRNEVTEFMRTADLGRVAARYPDVAALMWVLENSEEPEPLSRRRLPQWDPPGRIPLPEESSLQTYRLGSTAPYRSQTYGPGTAWFSLSFL